MLLPYLVGKWNGIDLWLQWNPQDADAYALRMRFWRTGAADWDPWAEMLRPWPINRSYHALPIHHQGWLVQAEVAPFVEGELAWERAMGAEFARSIAPFHFATNRKVTFPKGRVFAGQVDEFVASYRLREDLTLLANQTADVIMEAEQLTGGCQLDRPGHFNVQCLPGVWVRNTAPSENDLTPLNTDQVVMEIAPAGGSHAMAFSQRP